MLVPVHEISESTVLKVFLGAEVDSTELVQGDVINLSTSQLSVLPADLFLLSGDAIVNESMLTGESVPVSKAPVRDEDILKWRDDRTENPKTFLYCGTRVVRIRGTFTPDGQGRPALALVARTGMLFPSCILTKRLTLNIPRFQYH